MPANGRDSPIWHPFTQHGLHPVMNPVASANGAWLQLADGRRILDAISSWWVTTHGHSHPRIVAAIRAQVETLDQVIFAGFTHKPAESVARRLIEIAPKGLSRVFFSDSGSTSVEVALKMALGYFHNTGQRRQRIAALEHSYHGDTVGTMSAGARGVFNAPYEPLLFEAARIPFPEAGQEQTTLDAFERFCKAGDMAALIVEPLISGAGGMRIYKPSVLTELKRICEAYGALFIADEVMTGWGRTGSLFACEQAYVTPDVMCLAKGLTGGALPLAVTLCQEEIYAAHLSKGRARMFFHSSSYTANPVACAAAAANLDIWRTEPVLERIRTLSSRQSVQLERLRHDGRYENIRQIGTIAAFDVPVQDAGYLADIGPQLYGFFLDCGILLRPLGNTVYVMPPYCINEAELSSVYKSVLKFDFSC